MHQFCVTCIMYGIPYNTARCQFRLFNPASEILGVRVPVKIDIQPLSKKRNTAEMKVSIVLL
jgi:hypothetical protein